MATYKLIQDIEAEDHILGPLTLRQFIFALVAGFLYYLCFMIVTRHVYFLLILFLPPALFCTFFAVPFGRDQPTEIWALAKLRFWFKPRRRIWDQSGVKELVTITVPKKVERVLTNGLSQNEVESRLKVLAKTLDTRGWAIKNVNLNTYSPPNPLAVTDSDRLIDISNAPQEVPSYDVQAQDDILDETSNPVAQQFESMINKSSREHRQHLIEELNGIRTGQPAAPAQKNDYWFVNRPVGGQTAPVQPSVSAPAGATPPINTQDDAALSAQLKSRKSSQQNPYSHMRTLQPGGIQPGSASVPQQSGGANPPAQAVSQTPPQPSTPSADVADPAILSLANNNDLNVSTLARQAHKAKGEPPQDEVIIALH
ncbi:MAG TPA: PrgI family protein [Candidatus Saccharimonadales bacterium]|nr:PrgI family protein [Candidatus Saccharimonadales bacterium]